MTRIFKHFLRRLTRDRGLATQSTAFFALALTTCVFAIGSEDVLLAAIIPGLSWAILLLSSLLGLSDLIESDDIDDWLLAATPLPLIMLAKILSHFVATGLVIALLAPPVLLLLVPHTGLALAPLWAGFILGSATFSSLGLLGAALTFGSRKNAALQALIVMPLCMPPLIFGAGAMAAYQLDMGWQAPLAFLGAIAVLTLTLSPFAAAWILRMKGTG